MTLVLFDFDGTLSKKDSLGGFIKYAVSTKKYILGLIRFSPIFILYKLKIIKNSTAKEMLMRMFFKGADEKKFKKIAAKYSLNELDKILNDDVYKVFKNHIIQGHRVIVVSASMKCWLEPWCEKEGVELLSTQLSFIKGKFSGNFLTKNCHGIEKLNRVKELLSLDDYEEIYTYGDSNGDDEILSIADHKYKVINQIMKKI